jgi:hypothetical protein
MTAKEYAKRPEHWVGKNVKRLGKIMNFDIKSGFYTMDNGQKHPR